MRKIIFLSFVFLLFSFFLVHEFASTKTKKINWNKSPFAFGFTIEGFPITEEKLTLLYNDTKIYPQLILFYLQWQKTSDEYHSITKTLDVIWNARAVPVLTWEPMLIEGGLEKTIPYEDILKGLYDSYLHYIADEIKLWNKPLMIRFAHEMNLSRYHWGTNFSDFGSNSPEIYKKVFSYLVDFFRKEGVKNGLWVFCPNSDSIPNENWNVPGHYYPGDEYVDILGMDGYNWDMNAELAKSKNVSWTKFFATFEQIFNPLYQQLKQIAPDKPIFVFEMATVERPFSQKKTLWIKEAFETSKKWKINGLIWFQDNKEEDWRIGEDNNFINAVIHHEKKSFQEWLLNELK